MGLNRGVMTALRRTARTLAVCLAIAASLLTFPDAIPWMIAIWLLAYSIQAVRARRAWLVLLVCFAVLGAKWIFWTPGLRVFAGMAAVVLLMQFLAHRRQNAVWSRRLSLLGLPVLWLAWGAMLYDWQQGMHPERLGSLMPDRPVVCLGDSLTSFGPQGGYPEYLADEIAIPVVNCGEPGITAERALRTSLPKALKSNPQVVVIELGEHEFLRGKSRELALENLERLIAACWEGNARVVLMEMPRGYMFDPYAGLERELARKHDLELIPDSVVRWLLLTSPTLPPGMWTLGPFLTEADGVHPNERGNRLLAQYVAASLERLYGPQIRRQPGSSAGGPKEPPDADRPRP